MVAALNIIKEVELHDHKKRGYFNNMITALPVAPDIKLLPFFYPYAPAGTIGSVTGFDLERVDGDLNVLQTYALSTAYITITNNGVNQVFSYNGNSNLLASFTAFVDGIFRYKITLASAIVFYSEIFEINYFKTLPITSGGDFSIYDFNDDFFV
jgi:hypothetical protein